MSVAVGVQTGQCIVSSARFRKLGSVHMKTGLLRAWVICGHTAVGSQFAIGLRLLWSDTTVTATSVPVETRALLDAGDEMGGDGVSAVPVVECQTGPAVSPSDG